MVILHCRGRAWQNIYQAVVSTQAASSVLETTATLNGTIENMGSPEASQHGFVWNTTGSPVVESNPNITLEGEVTATGTFSSSISGLSLNETYYVRAYATNSEGTFYGDEITFSTKTKLTLSGSFTVDNKSYDGTTIATISGDNLLLDGVIGSDDVSLTSVQVAFAQVEPGTDLAVSVINAELTGTESGKYFLSLDGAPNATASISAKELTLTGIFMVEDKTYDGNNNASIPLNFLQLVGVISGDDVSLTNVQAAFAQTEPGTDISVKVSSTELAGTESGNYILSLTGAPETTASISSKELTLTGSFVAADKTYDGTTTAAIAIDNLILTELSVEMMFRLPTFRQHLHKKNRVRV